MADGGEALTILDISMDSTFMLALKFCCSYLISNLSTNNFTRFRRKRYNKKGSVIEEESACGVFKCVPDSTCVILLS